MKKINVLFNCLLCVMFGFYTCKKDTPAVNPSSIVNNKTGTVIEGINAVIDVDTEWKDNYGGDTIDYYIKTMVRVVKDAILTIKPGVIIAFESAESGIRVEDNAGLNASGTINKQIILTSRNKTEGAWKGIIFASANAANKLSYARVFYAGSMKDAGYCDSIAAITLAKNYAVKVSITNSYISNSGGYGIWAGAANADLTFRKDTVLCFLKPPLAITANNMCKLDSSSHYGYPNITYVEVAGGEIKDVDTIQRLGVPYRIIGRTHVIKTLNISPGCMFEFSRIGELTTTDMSGANHVGIIKAIGKATSHIIFRGIQQQAGSWVGITITSPGANDLEYCEIYSGGSAGGYQNPSTAKGNIIVGRTGVGANATIKYCTISSSAGYGIAMFKDNITPANSSNVYTTNSRNGLIVETNTYVSNSLGIKGTY